MSKKIDMAIQAKQEIDNRRASAAATAAEAAPAAEVKSEQVQQAQPPQVQQAQPVQQAQTTNSTRIITEIQKNKREKIIISINEYSGHKYVDLRIHYTDGESPEYRPTKKGITIKPNISQQVIDAIFEASNQIIAEQNKS
jgi:ABC-type transporter Mla subunit MlaD